VPESAQPDPRRTPRDAEERAADHAAIDRLTTELLPALIVKLAATGLGELEVREGSWKVRLRRPGIAKATRERRPGERGARTAGQASHPGMGLTPVGPGRDGRDGRDGQGATDGRRVVATSPAVGIFQPKAEMRHGTTVRVGDRLGIVDMLGVAQEVVAPADGVVGSSLVEPGDAVEYGQELVVIDLVLAPAGDA
jgi:biotin carboxyl carrier protein